MSKFIYIKKTSESSYIKGSFSRLKHIVVIYMLIANPLLISPRQSIAQSNSRLAFKLNKNFFVPALAGFGENSYNVSIGFQAAKLLEVTYHEKNMVNFNIDFAGMQVRKQYHSGNSRPGGYLSGSFIKTIFSLNGFDFSIANRTILDYGINQFTSVGYEDDNAMHLEISNLTGISVQKILFKKQKAKLMLFSGLNVSNLELARVGYVATIMKYVSSHFFVLAKADNTTTFGHKLTLGVMYRIK